MSESDWRTIDSAPRDGTQLLACRDNGCSWDYYVVRFGDHDEEYPWEGDGNRYAEARLDYWKPLRPPRERDEG